MKILIHNNQLLENLSTELGIQKATEAMDRALRNMFDSSCVSTTALGAINAAKKLGRNDLAAEMEADLRHELEEVA